MCRVWNDKGQAITRQYTPVSPLDQRDWFEVVIKVGSIWGACNAHSDVLRAQAMTVEVLSTCGSVQFGHCWVATYSATPWLQLVECLVYT